MSTLIPGTLTTDKKAAEALGISRSTFWAKIVGTGKVAPIKLTQRCTRFRSDEVLALIAA